MTLTTTYIIRCCCYFVGAVASLHCLGSFAYLRITVACLHLELLRFHYYSIVVLFSRSK